MRKCIYCFASEPAQFNREHVLPIAFGRFRGGLVLGDCVCAACNHFFSRTTDLVLARESAEGLERYKWGIRSPEELGKFRYTAVSLRADVAGDFAGARVVLQPHDNDVIAALRHGGAIHASQGDGFVQFTMEELLSGAWNTTLVDWKQGVKLFGNDATLTSMRNALEAQGVHLSSWRPLVPPTDDLEGMRVTQEFEVTPMIARGIGKIAFNYLAFTQGPNFVCKPKFDAIRQFVRFGTTVGGVSDFLHIDHELPFAVDSSAEGTPVVHWLGIDSHITHRNLLGVVSLFGFLTYTVMLAADFDGPWPALPIAHLYNVRSLKTTKMNPRKPQWRHPNGHGK